MPRKKPALLVIALFAVLILCMSACSSRAGADAWMEELGYREDEVYPLTFHGAGRRSCPEIPVEIGGKLFSCIFDTGCGAGVTVTSELADAIDYSVLGRTEELNRDGSHRGWSERISLDSIAVCGETFCDIETNMIDWEMTSSGPYDGLIGLAFFQGRRVTLDYRAKKVAVSDRPIDYDALGSEYTVLPLLHATEDGQEDLPFFEAGYEGEPVCVYLDTGKNHSYLHDPQFPPVGPGLDAHDAADISIGCIGLKLRGIARADIAQAKGLPYPTMIELNSDQIWDQELVVTLDLIEGKILFRKR